MRWNILKLRKYEKTDSPIICSWIKDEESLYKWSADRIGHFPLNGNELNEEYKDRPADAFYPVCACDDDGTLLGHLFIRIPDANDRSIGRFGFVIVDSSIRGRGLGRKMLGLALDYARNELGLKNITLGVFSNNPPARKCYESAGFVPTGTVIHEKLNVGEWDCIEMINYYDAENGGAEADSIKEEKGISAESILSGLSITSVTDLRTVNPLVLAHVGDAAYELIIRTLFAETMDAQVQKVHKKCTELVNAHAQCEIMHAIEEKLTEEEHANFKRGRNTKSYTMPKNANPAEYRTATGFEALIGQLYLSGNIKRIYELIFPELKDRINK